VALETQASYTDSEGSDEPNNGNQTTCGIADDNGDGIPDIDTNCPP